MEKRAVLFLIIFVSCFHPIHAEEFYAEEVTAFVSPDNSFAVLGEFIDSAQEFIYINVYTFDNPYIAEHIANALSKGVNVKILLEGSPVGGISENEKQIINTLASVGAQIYFSSDDRFRFLHGKYVVVDNRSILITSENFGYTGFPVDTSYGNRGWGIVIESEALSSYYSNIFLSDIGNGELFSRYNDTYSIDYSVPKGGYIPKFESKKYSGHFIVEPFLAPENAVDSITALIESANESVYINQFYIYKYWGKRKGGSVETTPNLFLEAAVDAARRGCEVKVLLDSTWYNMERDDPVSNYYTAKYVNEIAAKEGLNLEAKIIDLKKAKFTKMHAKGVVIDEKKVLVSSVNWNEHSPKMNREVGVSITGEVAIYFLDVFMHDWGVGSSQGSRQGAWIYIAGAFVVVVIIALWRKRHAS